MTKVWFVFINDRHIGPFSFEEVKERLDSGEFSESTIIWKEGEKSWVPISDQEVFKYLFVEEPPVEEQKPSEEVFQLPDLPELPPIPMDTKPEPEPEPEVEPEVEEVIEEEEDQGPPPFVLPPVPEVEPEPEIEEEPEVEPEPEIEEEPEVEPEPEIEEELEEEEFGDESDDENEDEIQPQVTKSKKGLFRIIPFLLVIAVLGGWLYFYLNNSKVELPFDDLYKEDIQKLTKVLNASVDKSIFHLALSKDGKKLVVASNFKRPANLYLELNSLDKQILASESVRLNSFAPMEDGIAVFDKIKIEKGSEIADGMYSFRVQGIDTSLTTKFIKILKRTGVFEFLDFVKNVDDRMNYRGDFLLGFRNKSDFDKELKNFQKDIRSRKTLPLRELLESYRTYGAILNQVSAIFKESLQNFQRRGSSKTFMDKYSRFISPLYQTIAIENQKTKISLIESDNELASEYKKLVEFGKEIGIIVTDMNKQLNSYKKLSKKDKLNLLKEFSSRINQLEELCKMRIYKLKSVLSGA